MSDIATTGVSVQTLEHVLGTGDLSKLSTSQRVEYYGNVCRTLGLNPLTRPFRFLALNGQIQLYATRDCTDQLRKVNGITLHVVDKQLDGDLFIVTVRARDKHGREDEDMGAVALGNLRGESRANALMKAMTKAKRRVTLSICGLGLTDESELDTIPGAAVFDADEPPPATKSVKLNKAPLPPVTPDPLLEADSRKWLVNVEVALADTYSQAEVEKVADHAAIKQAIALAPADIKRRLNELLANAYGRFADPPADDLPDVAIVGEDKLAG